MSEPDGPVKPVEVVGIESGGRKSLQAFGMGAATAEAADVESIGTQGGRQGRVVKLRIVGQGHHRATRVQVLTGQRVVGPVVQDAKPVKALWRSKRAARIDHRDAIAEHGGHGRQRLRDVHRADDEQPQRRIEHMQKCSARIRWIEDSTASCQQRLAGGVDDFRCEPTAITAPGEYQRLASGFERRHQHHGAAVGTRRQQLLEQRALHDSSGST